MAIVLAAASMPASASGLTAASTKSRVWIAIPVGAMATIGGSWAGLAHVADIGGAQPVRDGLALDEAGVPHVGGEEVEKRLVPLEGLVDHLVLGHRQLAPVARAAPSAHASTRRKSSHMVSIFGALT